MLRHHKRTNLLREAFTLIEVMVAVLIISVVIATLLQMRGNSTHIFLELDKQSKVNQFSSFFISNQSYGFETKNISLDDLIFEFEVEDDLRRELKDTKVEIIYQEISTIDISEFDVSEEDHENYEDENQDEENKLAMVFEIGNSILKTKDTSTALLRLKLQ